ncbi:uncharacterized protein [Nicotiana tomentosiformis]|uniref:uncharacterized protein n=1 Tax=Nicotiana tomentosiformis TaxID=4098 RepID=UPI00388C737D
MKGVIRFGKKGKSSPRYIGPFGVLEMVGYVAYKLALPPSLSSVHLVFHFSMLRKYFGDPSHVLDFSIVQLDGDLTYDEQSVAILDRQVQKLRSKNIASVKVQWRDGENMHTTAVPCGRGAAPSIVRGRGRGKAIAPIRGRGHARLVDPMENPVIEE